MFAYLDYLTIANKVLETQLQTLEAVLQRLQEAGFKVKRAQCEFLKAKSKFLGHKVDGERMHTLEDKITDERIFLKPQNVGIVRFFL